MTASRRAIVRSWSAAAKLFVICVIGVLLYVGHAAFVPVALALLLSLILSGPVEALHRRRISRGISAALILLAALALTAGMVAALWQPAQTWYAKAPQTMATVKKRVRPVVSVLRKVDDLRDSASSIASPAPASTAPAPQAPPAESAPELLVHVGIPIVAAAVTFVIVTLFLLTGGPPMLARMTAAFFDDLKASQVLAIIEKVRTEVGHFYLTTTLINIGLGLATSLAMWAWGMPTPFLWGALAAIVNYIPYAGAAATLIVVTLVAAVSFTTVGDVLGVLVTQLGIATVEGQIVQPLLVGRRLEVNPLLVFLALWFGGVFWGVAGIVLATPVLVTMKVIAENSKSGKPMIEFLGPNFADPRDRMLETLVRGSRRLRPKRGDDPSVPSGKHRPA